MFRKERLQLKKRKNAALKVLLLSAFITFICFSMLVGTTYAWLTDSVTSGRNKIISGSLSVELNYLNNDPNWVPATDEIFSNETWEPGRAYCRAVEVRNNGDIPVKYSFKANVIDEHGSINTQGEPFYISSCIKSYQYQDKDDAEFNTRATVEQNLATKQMAIDSVNEFGFDNFSELTGTIGANSAIYIMLVLKMPESGVEASTTKDGMPEPTFSIEVDVAVAQAGSSSDSFGNDVASNATVASVSRPTKYYVFDTATGLYKTEENNVKTYYVSSKEDFNKFVNKVNGGAGFDGSIVSLENDIDLSENNVSVAWTPVTGTFKGTFKGNNHKISGFKLDVLNADTEYALFGSATGQFNNLTVNVTINKTDDPVTSATVDRVVGNNGIISLVLA
ncbi:MAG: hypothetical protein IKS88_00380 [Clostridia bacterium]|nr:hypothetical protein [Clostridia bacterium]